MTDRRDRSAEHAPAVYVILFVVTAVVGAWSLDVLLRIRQAAWPFSDNELLAFPRQFVGLLFADVKVGLLVAVPALVGGLLVSRFTGRKAWRDEAACLLSAALVAASSSGLLAFPPTGGNIRFDRLVAVLLGGATWLLMRLLSRRADGCRSTAWLIAYAVYPALMVGLVIEAVVRLVRNSPVGWANGILIAACAVLAFFALRLREYRGKTLAMVVPPMFAIIFAATLCVYTAKYPGASDVALTGADGPRRGSIVLIVLDTVRADRLALYGHERNTMPELEKWAGEGVIFERAVAPSGWTAPSHASFFSGRTVSQHGVHYGLGTFKTRPVDGIEWLPATLAAEGYRCLAISANRLALPYTGVDMGFHRVLLPHHESFTTTMGAIADRRIPLLIGISEKLRWRMPHLDAAAVKDIVMRAMPESDRPVFLFVNMLDAHSPYNPPPVALDQLGLDPPRAFPRYVNHRGLTQRWKSLPQSKFESLDALYDAELRWLDMQLAELLPWLRERLGDDCLVIVTSDHGEELGEESRVGHEAGLSQRLLHVPLFLRGAGLQPRRVKVPVTLRRLYGYMLNHGRGQGADVSYLLEKDELGIVAERYVSKEGLQSRDPMRARPWLAEFDGRYKGIGPVTAGWQVMDMAKSGFRDGPLALEPPVGTEDLRKSVETYWEKYRDRRDPIQAGGKLSPDEWEKLRSLGYLK